MKKLAYQVVGLAVGLLSIVCSARAGMVLRFDQSAYTVSPGGTVDIQVYLRETIAAGGTSLLATEGLIGAAVRIRFDVPPVPSEPAQVLSVSDIMPSAVFDDAFGPIREVVAGESAGFSAIVDVTSPPAFPTEVAPDTFDLFLGSFRFTGGTTAGAVTNIRATDFSGLDETVTGTTGTVLDAFLGEADATIRVEASGVPEPSSWIASCMGTTIGFFYIRLRRRSHRLTASF
jgi:hypothetical protein